MEASALTHAGKVGLLGRSSALLRLQGDERLVGMIRDRNATAFEVLFDRYRSRLLAFCRGILGSTEDAEDVLQEVFVAAHAAMLSDERAINVKPWLYRIARNRCLNHLRKPVADGQDTMDMLPHSNGSSTADTCASREELREIFSDVAELPETQRTALVLREIDDLSYEDIAQAMGTTLPSVKSLLVRARMSLAESSEGRVLTCDEVRLELAEAAEGIRKVGGGARSHVRKCERCRLYRTQLCSSSRELRALAPFAPFAFLLSIKHFVAAKLGGSSSAAAGSGGAGSAGGVGAGGAGAGGIGAGAGSSAGLAGGVGATGAGAAATGVSGAVGGGALGGAGGLIGGGAIGAVGAKAAGGFATAALLTAGAVGVGHYTDQHVANLAMPKAHVAAAPPRANYKPAYEVVHRRTAAAHAAAPATTAEVPAPAPTDAVPNTPAVTEPAPATTTEGSQGDTTPTDDSYTSDDPTATGSSDGGGTGSTPDPTTPPVEPPPPAEPPPTTEPPLPPPDPVPPPLPAPPPPVIIGG